MKRPALLELRDIGKRFGAIEALAGVDMTVAAGEVVALVGDNGAGKSTLVKTIAGVQEPDRGEIRIDGQPVRIPSPQAATALGIETVYQDLALADNLDVVANMFLNRERVRSVVPRVYQPLSELRMEREARQALADLDVTTVRDVRAPVQALSGGQRQAVAIARAAMWHSRLVMLDEPTAALGVAQTRQVNDLILRLKRQELAVILISHSLDNVFAVSDRIVVLRLGHVAATFDRRLTTPDQVVAAITGAHEEVTLDGSAA
jgi:D-xylose transport system ATP-binding protein